MTRIVPSGISNSSSMLTAEPSFTFPGSTFMYCGLPEERPHPISRLNCGHDSLKRLYPVLSMNEPRDFEKITDMSIAISPSSARMRLKNMFCEPRPRPTCSNVFDRLLGEVFGHSPNTSSIRFQHLPALLSS